jgi:hypothetical protein
LKIRLRNILTLFLTIMVFASTLQLSLVELISVDEILTQSMLKDPLSEEEDRTTDNDELDDKLLLNSKVVYTIQPKVSKQNFNISNDQTYYSSLIKIQVPPPKHIA